MSVFCTKKSSDVDKWPLTMQNYDKWQTQTIAGLTRCKYDVQQQLIDPVLGLFVNIWPVSRTQKQQYTKKNTLKMSMITLKTKCITRITGD